MAANWLYDGLLGGRDWRCAKLIAVSARYANLLRSLGLEPARLTLDADDAQADIGRDEQYVDVACHGRCRDCCYDT